LVEALVCRLGRVRFSTGEAGAVAVLRGSGGTASDVFPLLAVVLNGISVVRRGRLSNIGDAEGPPFWWPTELGPGGRFVLTDGLPTSLGRDANICAAASKLCCGARAFAIVDGARGRVGEGGTEDFAPFTLEAELAGVLDWAGASMRTVLAGRWACERLVCDRREVGRSFASELVSCDGGSPLLMRLDIAVTDSLRPSVVVYCSMR